MVLLTALTALGALAADEAEKSVYDTIWDTAKLIDNDDATVLQSLALTGRLQGDAYHYKSDDNGSVSDMDWRRFRFGAKATLFHDFLIHVEADLDPNNIDNNDFYKGLTDAYIAWSQSSALKLKLGKQSAGFTLDGATSSKGLLTMERSIVADNLWFSSEYFTGISASGTVDGWKYNVGAFSSSGDAEFGEFDSGWFALASLGHAVSDNTDLRIDIVHNEPDYTGEVGTKKLTDIVSLVSQSTFGQFGFDTDVSFARGDDDAGQSDMMGLELMPYWDFNDRWQGVFRYSMVHCTDGPGASLGRYPKKFISSSKYEDIQDFYLGVNCYLYGHKLKWQAGVEYNLAQNDSTGNDYNGWGVSSGVRLSW
jgi:phosphate-selective porin OprO/OprP